MTSTQSTSLVRNQRIITRPWPAADWQTGRYIAEAFGSGQHYVSLDIGSGQSVLRWEVLAMPADQVAKLDRDAEISLIIADA